MKYINRLVMSALVMGLSPSTMEGSEQVNANRKRRVSPCGNLRSIIACALEQTYKPF